MTATAPAVPPGEQRNSRHRRRAILAVAALVIVAAAVIAVASGVFDSAAPASSGVSDNEYPTSLQTVERQPLSSQTQVSATLGYAGDTTIRLPTGNAPAAVTQAQQAVTTDAGMLSSARSSLSADSSTLSQAQATLSAVEQQEAVDCRGAAAAQTPASGNAGSGGSGACATDAASRSADEQAASADQTKVDADQSSVSSAEQSLAGAQTALASAQSQATAYGADSTYTWLPSAGTIVRRGGRLLAIDGAPVLLLYGSVVATRSFASGMAAGPDVAELNANLDALGYGHGLGGDAFNAATAAAIRALQAAHGVSPTGTLLLGSVIFESSAVRVTSLEPTVGIGATAMPGPVMSVSSTARQVTIALDAAQEGEVKVGDPVQITLPDNQTTPGRITYVSPVASSQGGSTSIEVDATPTDPGATGNLDQAPVDVSITTASVTSALVVPVDALLALASGGYAVEEVGAGGVHHLVAVSTGLFDDADGLVQVTGSGLAAGQKVVVPGV